VSPPSNDSSDSVASGPRKLVAETRSQSDDTISVSGQPSYHIAGLDLSSLWVDLVRQNKVSASMRLSSSKSLSNGSAGNETDIMVEYGVRMMEKSEKDDEDSTETTNWIFEDYVEQKGVESGESSPDPLISDIVATLARTQEETDGSGVKFRKVGRFVAQLQLVRTLRPPPSEGFLEATTSTPPPYDSEKDSFVTGPLRLELRPLVGRLELPRSDDSNANALTTPWDVFHNISPADRRGHFLLLPSLLDKDRNWRGQKFTKDDCHDLVCLTSTIEPAGSMFLGYNSVGAGASQNHIHCHSWPYPTMDSKQEEDDDSATEPVPLEHDPSAGDFDGNFQYAVANVGKIYDFYDIFDGKVEVSYLNYPVFCIQMSSSVDNLDLLGTAVAACLEAIGEASHNIGFLNRISRFEEESSNHDHDHDNIGDDDQSKLRETDVDDGQIIQQDEERVVDVFLFARSKERSSLLPTSKLGVSEMMGVFHAQSEAELDTLATINVIVNEGPGDHEQKSVMEQALADVSFENEEELWESIVTNLSVLDS